MRLVEQVSDWLYLSGFRLPPSFLPLAFLRSICGTEPCKARGPAKNSFMKHEGFFGTFTLYWPHYVSYFLPASFPSYFVS